MPSTPTAPRQNYLRPCTGMLATIERVVTETTHERLREPPSPAPVEKPWAPTPPPGFSVLPWAPVSPRAD
ncbi:hypothetical protein T492DRAFT_986938 [Pavlovales sp. CCMP2436]|nr:hypothetical protein T492DRAFT_986938 [Pavlovales sp. CCMP2436]